MKKDENAEARRLEAAIENDRIGWRDVGETFQLA